MTQIRKADPSDAALIARVHVESWRTTYAGIVPDDYLAQLSTAARAEMWQEALLANVPEKFIFVAEEDNGQIVGFVSGGTNRDTDVAYGGEIYAIYLLQAHQGRGVGRQLMRAAIAHLLEHDIRSMWIWVLADNPACGFYGALGGQPVAEKTVDIGTAALRELAYGWRDISEMERKRSGSEGSV